jgi:hypothetical protein
MVSHVCKYIGCSVGIIDMKYSVEMTSGGMIFIPSFIKTGSGIQKLLGGGGHRPTD